MYEKNQIILLVTESGRKLYSVFLYVLILKTRKILEL